MEEGLLLEEESIDEIVEKLEGKPLLQEFARWLHSGDYYSLDEIEELLTKEWDGAYPCRCDDLLMAIGDFLFYMGDFACTKVFGENYWTHPTLHIRIVPKPSYEYRSYLYILEFATKTVLAEGCGCKTWHHNPEVLESDLRELVEKLEDSKRLVGLRLLSNS